MNKTFDKEAFKEKLEAQMTFPALYMFKFIVPTGQEHEVAALLPNNKIFKFFNVSTVQHFVY
mgnify:CR=1 FL=1